MPCFAFWAVTGHRLEVPAIGLVHTLLTHWFPDVVQGLYLDGSQALLMTEFGEKNGTVAPLAEAEYRLGFRINPRVLSYSLPFYTALYFATPRQTYLTGYLGGLCILYALVVTGLVFLCLKELMLNLGSLFLDQPGVWVPGADVIGVLYQFNVLLVPTLAPAVLWLWQSRHSPLLANALRSDPPGQAARGNRE